DIKLSGKYLIENSNYSTPSNGDEAKLYINLIKSQVMSKNSSGDYDKNTGAYTNQQANKLINDFIDRVLVPSHHISPFDKFQIIKDQIMTKDNSGNYQADTGSL